MAEDASAVDASSIGQPANRLPGQIRKTGARANIGCSDGTLALRKTLHRPQSDLMETNRSEPWRERIPDEQTTRRATRCSC